MRRGYKSTWVQRTEKFVETRYKPTQNAKVQRTERFVETRYKINTNAKVQRTERFVETRYKPTQNAKVQRTERFVKRARFFTKTRIIKMANTYTQLYVHIVFSVRGRESLVRKEWKNDLYAYIGGIILNHKSKPLAINGMPDHIHMLIGYNPSTPLSTLVEEIKTSSNKWIKERHNAPIFSWQKGYGAFSYSRSSIDTVIRYIANQEEHHRKKTFREEYLEMLQDFEVEYKNEYLFDFQDISKWS